MGYYSDLRLITKKDGFEKIKDMVIKQEGSLLLEKLNKSIIYQANDLIYIGLNYVRGSIVDAIIEYTTNLEFEDMSYRLMIIGENLDDVEEYEFTSPNDNESDIPYPNIIRTFDDKKVKLELQSLIKENDKESIEI